ncbi:MAG TPA: winged helix-turn-helix domain-containing protein [Candidatus Binatia bacterium]|nr:winged helix-turn-helix domain-containing protein [Candidatus Binatia bacterium]
MAHFSKSVTAVSPSLQASAADSPRALPTRVCFGPYELDCKAGELSLGELKIVLQGQPHKILLMLIERPGELITRDEIQKRLWPDDVIVNFEVSISQAIRKLRRALNDSAEKPVYVETVGRRGYRLRVPVEVVEKPLGAAPSAGNRGFEDHQLQFLAGAMGVVHDSEELRLIAAALRKLLQILAYLDPPTLEWLQARPAPARQSLKPM